MVVIDDHLCCLICSEGRTRDSFDVEDSFSNVQLTRRRSKQDEIVLGVGAGVILLFIIILLVVWIRKKGYGTRQGAFPARLSLAEIKSVTKGGSWVVYEGYLASGKEVAIKRFSQVDPISNPFEQEIAAVVDCLKHKNLVQLISWCCEGDEFILVYDLMPNNGNLDSFLHFTTNRTSYLGVASALTYLHEECETQIIHRDVKACNPMLAGDYNAKLGDFRLAELYERKFCTSARTTTTPAGTMGYLAPECIHAGVSTEKTDVYRFGVVVLKVETGRRPVEIDDIVLVDKVWEMRSKGKLMRADDRRLLCRYEMRGIERMLMVGLACCVHSDSKKRPKMQEAERKFDTSAGTATVPAGTMGYLAPEYVNTGIPTQKTDGCSYGVVVLEVATGRRPVEIDGTVLVGKVWEMWSKGKLMEAVDSRLLGRYEMREMERMLVVGLACCVHPDSKKRPKMKEAERKSGTSARTSTITAGTMGYLAPEYVHTGVPTEKTDVCSFGEAVLEVATGRRPVEIDGTVLVDEVWEMWSKGKLMGAVDSRLMGRFEMREMERMLMVGLACVHPDSKKKDQK